MVLSAFPLEISAQEMPAQSPTSQEQVEKLLSRWKEHFKNAETLRDRRTAFRDLMDSLPEPTRIQIRHVDAGGVDAELMWPARLHHPIGRRAILFIHGGGFYSGSIRTHSLLAGSLAKAASSDVLLIDYRRAPEYSYPAQANDALSAYRYLLDSGYSNGNIIIVGDGAGGNLALETVLRQMRSRQPLPAAVVALSPITDLSLSGASVTANAAKDRVVDKTVLEALRKAYLGNNSATDPEVSPLYASLSGFPPLLLQVGSDELLLDDTLRFADKAQKAGVDVTTQVWPGMPHQWQLFPSLLEDADKAGQKIAEFAVAHFADPPEE
ncbi:MULTISPECIES: alpha/beta hydrolase [unclassified Rhizobium]|uniref:alpha/beta hydrolase n=1 Tax=unclassified Rhizobium TaxID=2613769 RepID=UPI001FDF516D|nr:MULTISPECIES: alpha/beta hydrolase [unclassified Rhizobium]